MVFGWCFLRDNWSESLLKRDWLLFYLVPNKAVVGLNRMDSVSTMVTGEHLQKTPLLARAALGIVHRGTWPVLCVCSSNSAGASVWGWVYKGDAELASNWSEVGVMMWALWMVVLKGAPFNRTVWLSPLSECPSYAELTVWNWFEKLLKSVFEPHFYFQTAQWEHFFKLALKRQSINIFLLLPNIEKVLYLSCRIFDLFFDYKPCQLWISVCNLPLPRFDGADCEIFWC